MNIIKEVLKDKGIQQKWLAEQTGISRNMIGHYCRNEFQPKYPNLVKIARILGVTVNELLEDENRN